MIITGDFETYHDRDYSLAKMSEVEYILDNRYQTIMLGLKVGKQPTETYVGHQDVARRLAKIDWDRTAWLSHNTRFDGSILAWRFRYKPKLYLDTLSMNRATLHWQGIRSSLKALSEYFGLPEKTDEVMQAQGLRLDDFTTEQLARYRQYCSQDVESCRAIFDQLLPQFTNDEMELIDVVLRMHIEPQVKLDGWVLSQHLDAVKAEKADMLAQVEATVDKEELSSNQKFAVLLESLGVDLPMKISPATGEWIPALARGDRGFKELCQDSSQPPFVQALLSTRLSVKSTIEETRTANLLRLSNLTWPNGDVGLAPVPLKYSGARTHRLSGDGGTNWQNITRGSLIRKGIQAPAGHRIIHRDASQIEARMTAWMAECESLLEAFAEGRDVYSEFASIIYGKTVIKEDKLERFVGKTSILGLGYSCGAGKFRHMLYIGNGGISLDVDEATAQRIVRAYRSTYPEIPKLWKYVDKLLRHLAQGMIDQTYLPVVLEHDGLRLPSGLLIRYPELGFDDEGELCYLDARYGTRSRIYGAKGVENISQALARIVITDVAVRVKRLTGYHPFLSTHDSLDYCVPEAEAEAMDEHLEYEFTITPEWAEGLPLASEGGFGKTLLDAEKGVNQ